MSFFDSASSYRSASDLQVLLKMIQRMPEKFRIFLLKLLTIHVSVIGVLYAKNNAAYAASACIHLILLHKTRINVSYFLFATLDYCPVNL